MTLLFVHGWGFDRHFWQPLIRALPTTHPIVTYDLGFRGAESRQPLSPCEEYIAIGHSLGFMWLAQHLNDEQIIARIAINSFSRFTDDASWPQGVPARELQLMQRQFKRHPKKTWQQFLQRTSTSIPETITQSAMDNDMMQAGLQWLAEWDVRAALQHNRPMLALCGEVDNVVPCALSSASFGNLPYCKQIWHPTGDHLLPIHQSHWCAQQIQTFIDEVSV